MGKLQVASAQAVRKSVPRPIHVKLLRYTDREQILRSAPKSLKGKQYRGNSVFISDDVTARVRADRAKLKVEQNKLRKDGKFALIPWSVPAYMLVKDGEGKLKRLYPNTK